MNSLKRRDTSAFILHKFCFTKNMIQASNINSNSKRNLQNMFVHTLQICTVFNCVPLFTVISLYGLQLIAIYYNVEVTVKKTVNQLYNYSTVLGAAIKSKPYSQITVESRTHLKTVKNTLNIFAVYIRIYSFEIKLTISFIFRIKI